ncbi:MAG TPA: hypothetical protein VIN77_14465 [Aurantimonas sp.]
MKTETIQFRSKTDREREVDLERNYRQIGIPAIAAASHGCCKGKENHKTVARAPNDDSAAAY